MPRFSNDFQTLLISASTFGLVMSLWMVIVLVWSMRRKSQTERLERRLGLIDEASDDAGRVLRLWHNGEEAATIAPGSDRPSLSSRLQKLSVAAGWEDVPFQSLLLGPIGLAAASAAIVLVLTGTLISAAAVAVGVIAAFVMYLNIRIARQTARFEKQFVDALDLTSRSLRVGHPLMGAFQLIAEELEPPVSNVFAEICQQQSLGLSLEDALRKAAAAGSSDVKLFATSVSIQLRSGGNLADMMERLASVIRERIRLSRRVRVLTTQTQFSKRILLAMPVFTFLLLNTINANYMKPLYTTTNGRLILVMGGIMMMIGSWMMNRLARLNY